MTVRILERHQVKLAINVRDLTVELLSAVPEEDLAGLNEIVLVDEIPDRRYRGRYGMYLPRTGKDKATILIAVDRLLGSLPRVLLLVPFVRKFVLANTLYHEVGHHYCSTFPNIRASERERLADRYRKKMVKRKFSSWRIALQPLRPLVRLLLYLTKREPVR